MSPIEFLAIYAIAGLAMFTAGYVIGSQRAESKVEQMRRWWFEREQRLKSWKE